MKIDLKALYYVAIHCTTKDEAVELVGKLTEAGFEWGNKEYHKEEMTPDKPFWSDKENANCYIFDEGTLWKGTVDYCREEEIEIIPYEEAVKRFF